MKKILLIIPICLLCFGCGKITININDNTDMKEKAIEKAIEKKAEEFENKIEEEIDDEESNLDKAKDKIKDAYESAKTWYEENKDEIKGINEEIIEEDKQTIKKFYDSLKNNE